MVEIESLKDLLKSRLSKKRYQHSLNVADSARELAKVYGADADKAYLAGLLHDICKEDEFEVQKQYVLASRIDVSCDELASSHLWHGIAGAYYLKSHFDINDVEIINAIRFHTVGRAGMSKLEEIVYLADMISADRDYKEVDRMRELAFESLEKAMFEALGYSITKVIKKAGYISNYTMEAYNQYAYINRKHKGFKE